MLIQYPLISGILANALWGMNVVAIKIGIAEVSPALLNVLRFALLTCCLLPFARIKKNQVKSILIIAAVMGLGHFYLMSLGAVYVDSNTAVMIIMLGAPFSSLLAFLLKIERLTRLQFIGMFIAFISSIIPVLLSDSVDLKWGAAVIVIAMLVWASINIRIHSMEGIPVLTLQFWIGLISTPLCLTIYTYEGGTMDIASQLTPTLVMSVLFIVFGSSILAYSLWFSIISKHGINKVINTTLLQPIFTIILAYILLNESVSTIQLIAAAGTIIGISIFYYRGDSVS
ncbi:MAG: DMT family transporter [Moritella sp.]|uniref:DMT family transporter n=1 Tax=Moritella sp. TaxID=78556 RepID=UPI0025CEF299|nr:DMT family transporter [Moritella sp.]NQZ92452.1 DMT family transporter [Moritella sp.]